MIEISSCSLEAYPGSQHGTDLGPFHLCDNCVAWSIMGPLAVGPRLVPDA